MDSMSFSCLHPVLETPDAHLFSSPSSASDSELTPFSDALELLLDNISFPFFRPAPTGGMNPPSAPPPASAAPADFPLSRSGGVALAPRAGPSRKNTQFPMMASMVETTSAGRGGKWEMAVVRIRRHVETKRGGGGGEGERARDRVEASRER